MEMVFLQFGLIWRLGVVKKPDYEKKENRMKPETLARSWWGKESGIA